MSSQPVAYTLTPDDGGKMIALCKVRLPPVWIGAVSRQSAITSCVSTSNISSTSGLEWNSAGTVQEQYIWFPHAIQCYVICEARTPCCPAGAEPKLKPIFPLVTVTNRGVCGEAARVVQPRCWYMYVQYRHARMAYLPHLSVSGLGAFCFPLSSFLWYFAAACLDKNTPVPPTRGVPCNPRGCLL
jgi:hypothetical protein